MTYKIKNKKSKEKGIYKYKNYVLKNENGMLNLKKPEDYEGTYIGKKKPTKADKESVVADYYDLPNREIPLHKEEIKEIKKNFTEKEQRKILGYTIKEFKER
jgi:hypothetical protein